MLALASTLASPEINLIREHQDRSLIAIEIKASSAPTVSKDFHQAVANLKPAKAYVLHSGEGRFPMKDNAEAIGLAEMMTLSRNRTTHD